LRRDRDNDARGIVHMNQIQIRVWIGGQRFAADQLLAARYAARAIDTGHPQHDFTARHRASTQDRFCLHRPAAAFTGRFARRLFVDPTAVGLAIHAGGADVDETLERRRKHFEQILQPIHIDLMPRLPSRAVKAYRIKHTIDVADSGDMCKRRGMGHVGHNRQIAGPFKLARSIVSASYNGDPFAARLPKPCHPRAQISAPNDELHGVGPVCRAGHSWGRRYCRRDTSNWFPSS
jgi:hypothetical protein